VSPKLRAIFGFPLIAKWFCGSTLDAMGELIEDRFKPVRHEWAPGAAVTFGIKTRAEFVEVLRKLCQQGDTINEVAEQFCVEKSEVRGWIKRIPGVAEAMQIGWDACLQRIQRKIVDAAIEGDINAAKFVLMNKLPEEWGKSKGQEPRLLNVNVENMWMGLEEAGRKMRERIEAQREREAIEVVTEEKSA
jgi:hypothetical protein